MNFSIARLATRHMTLAACFSVLVVATSGCSDGMSLVATQPDTLNSGSPAPQRSFDLRFKGVGVETDSLDLVHENFFLSEQSVLQFSLDSTAGSPLELGGNALCSASECDWFFDTFALPRDVVPVGVAYTGSVLANLPAALDTNAVTDTVIASLDIRATPGLFAVSKLFTPVAGGYRLNQHVVTLAALPAAAAAEGVQKRVITAVSFDAGQVRYLSYSWAHDSAAAGYDTQVVEAAQDAVANAAVKLGASGYVVTALGGNNTDGFVLVGTRVHGDTRARSVLIDPDVDSLSGYAVVGNVLDDAGRETLVYER